MCNINYRTERQKKNSFFSFKCTIYHHTYADTHKMLKKNIVCYTLFFAKYQHARTLKKNKTKIATQPNTTFGLTFYDFGLLFHMFMFFTVYLFFANIQGLFEYVVSWRQNDEWAKKCSYQILVVATFLFSIKGLYFTFTLFIRNI